jgi:hypothetical protein
MATVNYSWNLPTVGGSEDTWGTSLNANWTDLDTLLGGVSQTEFAILDGATVTTAELNVLDGVTATTAELNILDGVTATAAEINQLDGNGFTADVLPDADSTRDLGSSTKAWAEAHVDTVISTNVSDGTTSVGTTYVTNGSAKAWVNLNGTGTIALRDSFNVSSVTDNGTGQYTFNYTNNMANANYRAQTGVGDENYAYSVCPQETNPLSASAATAVFIGVVSTTTIDVSVVSFGVHGDLA